MDEEALSDEITKARRMVSDKEQPLSLLCQTSALEEHGTIRPTP